MAFCHRELPSGQSYDGPSQKMEREQSPSPQNAATGTLQACALQNFPKHR
jgi:hypothetical protein